MRALIRSAFAAASSAIVLGLGAAWPGVATACSVCTAGRDEENQLAFLLSTIFMSLLPLIVIGTIVALLWWRVRQVEAERAASSDSPETSRSRSEDSSLGDLVGASASGSTPRS